MEYSDPIMSCGSNEPKSRYIRDESSNCNHDNETIRKIEQPNPKCCEFDDSIDPHIFLRCPVFMTGSTCHKGDYCERIHRLPKEDSVVCKYFKGDGCQRSASNCWFWHPGVKYDTFTPAVDAPRIVQSVGDLMKYIRNEQAVNPDKYKGMG